MGATPAIGIVGGGQLAAMLAEAAQRQGVALHVQTPSDQDPAVPLASSVVFAPLGDVAATAELARRCTAISFENEWLDPEALAPLVASGVQMVPSLEALRPLLCKRSQRELLQRLHLPSPRWFPLAQVLAPPEPPADEEEHQGGSSGGGPDGGGAQDRDPSPAVPALPEGFGFPVMAKAATGGYDGRGTALLRSTADLEALLARVDPDGWIVEEFVAFEQELAVVAARDSQGEVVLFPLVQTHQHAQVCDWVLAPADSSHALEQAARNIAASLLTSLNYVGVLAIEFFYGPQGLLINELAPRTHNSGHYTIEACTVSQFQQQLRVVTGELALESDLVVPGALMVNLLGIDQRRSDDPMADYSARREALQALPGAHLHWYGKAGSSVGRKLGHITLLLQEQDPVARRREAMERLAAVRQIWPLPPS